MAERGCPVGPVQSRRVKGRTCRRIVKRGCKHEDRDTVHCDGGGCVCGNDGEVDGDCEEDGQ